MNNLLNKFNLQAHKQWGKLSHPKMIKHRSPDYIWGGFLDHYDFKNLAQITRDLRIARKQQTSFKIDLTVWKIVKLKPHQKKIKVSLCSIEHTVFVIYRISGIYIEDKSSHVLFFYRMCCVAHGQHVSGVI